MSKQSTIFKNEEKTIEKAQAVLDEEQYQNNPLMVEFSELFKSYRKMFKQFRYLIRSSDQQQRKLNELNKQLEVATRFIRKIFGRYVSDEIVDAILKTPEGLKLGGEKRRITIMMTDLRGFTAVSERWPADDVVNILNTYFEVMTEIILKYQGTIDGFIGDGIITLFGSPILRDDDAQRAVACALEMQLAMDEVNARNRNAGYPQIAMGIGINTGEVVVGNIGSSKRMKYSVIGRPVNLASRIESYTVGGQIFISESTLIACGDILRIDDQVEVTSKGVKESFPIYEVGGIEGDFNLFLSEKRYSTLNTLPQPLPIRFTILEGKHIGEHRYNGNIIKLNARSAEIQAQRNCRKFTNLKLFFSEQEDSQKIVELYAKVIKQLSNSPPVFLANFTSVPPETEALIESVLDL